MLKKRLMGVVVVRSGIAVQSFDFGRYLPIGRPEILVEALDSWGVDEISVIDISATRRGGPNVDLVRLLSRSCQVPLTYGGGIRTAADMATIVQAGADKVMVNQAFRRDTEIVPEGAQVLGSQCIVVSLDVTRREDGSLAVYDYLAGKATDEDPARLAVRIEAAGAGELFLTFVDRDGSKRGYDLDAARVICAAVKIPVTLCGGVGHPSHFAAGLEVDRVSAVAAANFLSFTEHSVTTTKAVLRARFGADLRLDTYFDYAGAPFEESGRVAKKDDAILKELLFEFHPQDVV